MAYNKDSIRICGNCGKPFHPNTNTNFCEPCRYVVKNCKWCGKEFRVHRSHDRVEHCSGVCGAAWRWRNIIQERAKRREPCANCGKPITRKWLGYGKNKKKHLFCDNKCYGEWRSKNLTGEKHHRWKGGYKEYYGGNWESQRKKARKRDGYKCRRCGITEIELGKELDVHHITPFRIFGIARYQEANRLTNLVSACPVCHAYLEHHPQAIHSLA